MPVIYSCLGLSYCPYYQGVCRVDCTSNWLLGVAKLPSTPEGSVPYKHDGDACWKITIKPLEKTNLGMVQVLKETHLNPQHIFIGIIILLLTTQSDTFIGFLSFHVCKTLSGDQNLQILCLSETRSIPINFIWESPSGVVYPVGGGVEVAVLLSIVLHASETGEAWEEVFCVCLCIHLPWENLHFEMKTHENPVNIFMVFF